jgi:hypothetical protein
MSGIYDNGGEAFSYAARRALFVLKAVNAAMMSTTWLSSSLPSIVILGANGMGRAKFDAVGSKSRSFTQKRDNVCGSREIVRLKIWLDCDGRISAPMHSVYHVVVLRRLLDASPDGSSHPH